MVAIIPSFANSQVSEKDMFHFALEQYIKSQYDTTSRQVVYFEVIGEKVPHYLKYGDIMVSIWGISKEKKLLHKATKKTNGYYHTMTIKRFGNDTVDILFCECQVSKSGRNYKILMESGGDAGYIPFIRFVYNDIDKKWNYYFAQELMREKYLNKSKQNKVR
jgi:hypothetical protein